jgi:hypothetical protein
MEKIIEPLGKELLLAELTDDKFIRKTNNSDNDIYIFTSHESPNLMKEIGRLREESFRIGGGGTGKSTDIDEYDTNTNPYKQLIVWDPENQEILGGYRFFNCNEQKCETDNKVDLSTAHLFEFSNEFKRHFLGGTIELGRSFVHPLYQSGQAGRKGIFALDNLWDGLGSLIVDYPHVKYFFGKITMYQSFDKLGRDLILYFMNKYFGDREGLVKPHKALAYYHSENELANHLNAENYRDDYKQLSQKVRSLGDNIPPLFNAYMNLSSSMKCFGTAVNDEFGDVEETGILITIQDIYSEKSKRHIESYINQISKDHPGEVNLR